VRVVGGHAGLLLHRPRGVHATSCGGGHRGQWLRYQVLGRQGGGEGRERENGGGAGGGAASGACWVSLMHKEGGGNQKCRRTQVVAAACSIAV